MLKKFHSTIRFLSFLSLMFFSSCLDESISNRATEMKVSLFPLERSEAEAEPEAEFSPILNIKYNRDSKEIELETALLVKSEDVFKQYLELFKKIALVCKYEFFYGDSELASDAESDYLEFLKLLKSDQKDLIKKTLEGLEKKYQELSCVSDIKEKIRMSGDLIILSAKDNIVIFRSKNEISLNMVSNKLSEIRRKISSDEPHIKHIANELKLKNKMLYLVDSYVNFMLIPYSYKNLSFIPVKLFGSEEGLVLQNFVNLYKNKILTNESLFKHYLQYFNPEDESNIINSKKIEYGVESPKIGCEIEFLSFTQVSERSLKKGELIAKSSENGYEIQADYDAAERRSDLEFVSSPFPLNMEGVKKLVEVSHFAKKMLLSISKGSRGWYPLQNLSSFDQSLNYSLEVAEIEKTDETVVTPQFTLAMSLGNVYGLYLSDIDDCSRTRGIFRIEKKNNYVRCFLDNYKKNSFVRKIIGEEFYENDQIKGYLLLIYTYLSDFSRLTQSYTLKNNLPAISSRVGFDLLFQTLPEEFQERMRRNNGENFVQLMKLLLYGFPLGIDYMEKSLFEGELVHEFHDYEKREFIPHLSKRKWLISIIQGNDLLVAENHKNEFPQAKPQDLQLLNCCFAVLGNKLEIVAGKPEGIFELRHHSRVEIEDLPRYTEEIAKYLLEKSGQS